MSAIEKRVAALNELRKQADDLEDFMRRMRLGAHPGLEVRRIWWRRGVFAFGYDEQQVEAMPAGMEQEFYSFLGRRYSKLGERIRREESLLASVTEPDVSEEAP